MKILIAEDEKALSNVLKDNLESEGFEVEAVFDGEAALGTAENFKPDLVILDLLLPRKNGLEVLAELKASESLKAIPVIVLSNLADDESVKNALALGAIDYFVKTGELLQGFTEKIKKYLGKGE